MRWSRPFAAVIDFLLAERCVACGRDRARETRAAGALGRIAAALAAPVSVRALGLIPIENRPFCARCLLMLREAGVPQRIGRYARVGTVVLEGGAVFGDARGRNRATTPLEVMPAFHTNDALLRIVHEFKFTCRESLAGPLAVGLARVTREWMPRERPVVVPVPTDMRAMRERGFNPARELAVSLCAHMGVPLADRALVKPRRVPRQSTLTGAARARNVRDAYRRGPHPVEGRQVLLVDDLVTTGATAAACAAVLLSAGAAGVRVASVGRTPAGKT